MSIDQNLLLPPNPIRDATLEFLNQQRQRGFRSEFMLSFHYANADERGWNRARRTPSTGHHRSGSAPSLLSQPTNSGITRTRNDFFKVSQNVKHIRNLLRREIWGVKRMDKVDESETPMMFFHEKGQGTQYHTHLILGTTPEAFKTIESLEALWETKIRPRTQCLSPTNSVHIQIVDSPERVFGYLSKEVSFQRDVIDYEASCLFRQPSAMELLIAEVEEEARQAALGVNQP